jgi:hypothetical protein
VLKQLRISNTKLSVITYLNVSRYVRVRVRVCARVYVRVCVRVCARVYVYTMYIVQRSLTEYGVSKGDREPSKARSPLPARGCQAVK